MSRIVDIDPNTIRSKNTESLKDQNIPVNDHLPLIDVPAPGTCPASQSIAQRLVVVYALTGLAHEADSEKLYSWLDENAIAGCLSPKEIKFFRGALTPQDVINLSWRGERMLVFAWALGIVASLPPPNVEADLNSIFPNMPPQVDFQIFIQSAERIGLEKIYSFADRYYCYHWALKHSDRRHCTPNICIDTIRERRTALEWLIGVETFSEDISLDT